jgi:hypothetical protein
MRTCSRLSNKTQRRKLRDPSRPVHLPWHMHRLYHNGLTRISGFHNLAPEVHQCNKSMHVFLVSSEPCC